MRRDRRKRLAALEQRLLPPPKVIWCVWQALLDDDEYGLVLALASRGARHGGDPADVSTWCNDWEAWAALCHDEGERTLLERIRAVVETNPDVRNSSGWHDSLWEHLSDLRL